MCFPQSETVGVWVGIIGQSPVVQVYPSPALEWLWNMTSTALDNILTSASLAVDAFDNVVAVSKLHYVLVNSHFIQPRHATHTPKM